MMRWVVVDAKGRWNNHYKPVRLVRGESWSGGRRHDDDNDTNLGHAVTTVEGGWAGGTDNDLRYLLRYEKQRPWLRRRRLSGRFCPFEVTLRRLLGGGPEDLLLRLRRRRLTKWDCGETSGRDIKYYITVRGCNESALDRAQVFEWFSTNMYSTKLSPDGLYAGIILVARRPYFFSPSAKRSGA